MSGKSLFIKNILFNKKFLTIPGKNLKVSEHDFPFIFSDVEKDVEVLYFDDIPTRIFPLKIFPFISGEIRVNQNGKEIFHIQPQIILEYSDEIDISEFARRNFDIINTNTISYKRLIDFIKKWNKL